MLLRTGFNNMLRVFAFIPSKETVMTGVHGHAKCVAGVDERGSALNQ